MFRFKRNHHQEATASAWLKLQDWFSVDIDVVQTLPMLWRHSMTCVACVLCTVPAYTLAQCTTHTPHRSYYAAITLTTSAPRVYQH